MGVEELHGKEPRLSTVLSIELHHDMDRDNRTGEKVEDDVIRRCLNFYNLLNQFNWRSFLFDVYLPKRADLFAESAFAYKLLFFWQ